MTLETFLDLHDGGVACVSIYESTNGKDKYYCEEEYQEDILDTEWFESIAERKIKKFCVIGGGMYKVELSIELEA